MKTPLPRARRTWRAGHKSPELLGLRGLAKSKRRDFRGAIDDFTVALSATARGQRAALAPRLGLPGDGGERPCPARF